MRVRMISPRWARENYRRKYGERDSALNLVRAKLYYCGAQDLDSMGPGRLSQLVSVGLLDDDVIAEAMATMAQEGELVDAATAAAELETPNRDKTEQVLTVQAALGAIARFAEAIANDVSAMGVHALTATGTGSRPLPDRMRRVYDELKAIQDELIAARKPFVDAQIEELGLAGATGLKVHLGAGGTRLDGWINIDMAPAELALNVGWGLPFDDRSVKFIYAGHLFEHLYYASEATALLREARRVLEPGGVFRLIVPNMQLYFEKYAARDHGFFEHRKSQFAFAQLLTTPMEHINSYSRTERDPSEFFTHKWAYDFETLDKIGRKAGFSTVIESAYMASQHEQLRVDEISPAATLSYDGRTYSLFVELTA